MAYCTVGDMGVGFECSYHSDGHCIYCGEERPVDELVVPTEEPEE